MAGCGSSTPNSNSPYDADSGHPSNWLPAGHMVAAQEDQNACAECHGSDFTGGISGVSCSNCHLGGAIAVHPTSWGNGTQIALNHAPYVTANGATACSNINCHGADLNGGAGPACSTCHLNGSPLVLTGCTSCHGRPPSGTVSPNRSGAHNAVTGHFAAQVTLPDECSTCHNGAGSGTLNHDNGTVDVAFLSAYSAKTGTAVRNADGTCSKVSCHGGQTTPVWLTGSMDVTTQCTSCHAYGTSEYNSYASGEHDFHVNGEGIGCIICHDTTALALTHFAHLDTPELEGPASSTLRPALNYTGGSCTPACHVNRMWF